MKEAQLKALELLNALESVTKESLSAYRTPDPAPPAPPRYTSARTDYRPALEDPEVVDALLAVPARRLEPPVARVIGPQDWGRLHARRSSKKKNPS